ncbi:hypothetical protein ACFVWR_04275 [Leifsonia sp. NPDC058292]|uniref:hypothetical protein n=1 Tax=Leifsonia sp. NPDC058292 TaxID=3346428 RepID=UPI0036DD92F3
MPPTLTIPRDHLKEWTSRATTFRSRRPTTRRRMRWPNWFRKRAGKPSMRPFDEKALIEIEPASLDQSVEEGMLLADYATRMAVKNHIVVDTIQLGNAFDPARHTEQAAEMLRELADEQEQASARAAEAWLAVAGRGGDAEHPHDYRDVDGANLLRREAAATALADALRTRADSDEELLAIVERSRKDAWDEVGDAIGASLDAFSGVEALKAGYEEERPGRLRLLIQRDLARLQEERGGY